MFFFLPSGPHRLLLTSSCLGLLACRPTDTPEDPFARNCEEWCRKQYDCSMGANPLSKNGLEACVDACIDAYELKATDLGPACQDAYADAMACLGAISCAEYARRMIEPTGNGPCADVLIPYFDLCPGVFLAPDVSTTTQ
jgi:hypothetical protein